MTSANGADVGFGAPNVGDTYAALAAAVADVSSTIAGLNRGNDLILASLAQKAAALTPLLEAYHQACTAIVPLRIPTPQAASMTPPTQGPTQAQLDAAVAAGQAQTYARVAAGVSTTTPETASTTLSTTTPPLPPATVTATTAAFIAVGSALLGGAAGFALRSQMKSKG